MTDSTGPQPRYPSQEQLAEFIRAVVPMLTGLSCVERFAWSALPADLPGTGRHLGTNPTPARAAYRATG